MVEREDTSAEPDEVWTGSGEEDQIREAPTDEQWLDEPAAADDLGKVLTNGDE